MSKFKPWNAYRSARDLANLIFEVSKQFPKEEKYSLTDQVRRSSRSVCANLAESFGKRRYPRHFISKLTDAISENHETEVWIDFAHDNKYIGLDTHTHLTEKVIQTSKLLYYMLKNPNQY